MISKMKTIASFSLMLLLGVQAAKAQLGSSFDDIIKKFGTIHGISTADQQERTIANRQFASTSNGFIHYRLQDSSAASGKYSRSLYFYFTQPEEGNEYCNEELIVEPNSEKDNWIDTYKSKYQEIGYRKYMDTTNNVFFKIRIRGHFCAVNIWYDK